MIYLSPDYESGNEQLWDDLLRRPDVALQYPYEIGVGDICIVEATLGAEYVPGKKGGGIVVGVVLHDLYAKRRQRINEGHPHPDDFNIQIHHTNGFCLSCDRIAVTSQDGAAEVARMLTEELAETGGKSVDVDVVEDWGKYIDGLKGLAKALAGLAEASRGAESSRGK
jgi:hypothetical protein